VERAASGGSCSQHSLLLGLLDHANLLTGGHHVDVLDTHNTTSPGSAHLLILVELEVELSGELLEVDEVLSVDTAEGDTGGGLLVDESTEGSLSTDEAVSDGLLSAEGGEEAHDLDGIDIVGNDNELGGTVFNELGNVVESELEEDGLSSGLGISGSSRLESVVLGLSGLGRVLGEELEEVSGLRFVNSVGELGNAWGDLESLHEDSLLSLDSDVLGPFDESGEIFLGLDVASNSEVSGALLEEGVLLGSGTTGLDDSLLSLFLLDLFALTEVN